MSNVLETKALTIAFPGEQKPLIAVDSLNFVLKPGETLALLGESGCGKSLTAHALMRLLPDKAMYGAKSDIKLDVLDLLNLPEYWMRTLRGRRIAIVFQDPMTALNPVLSIEAQLKEALDHRFWPSHNTLHKELVALLEEVEMPEPEIRLRQFPHQLSGGQKQRVVIALALAKKPEIIIADEPTTALDVTVQAQILGLLKKLQQERNMSMLLVTHDLGVVKAVADRVAVMYAGQWVEEASVEEFFQSVKHPYSQQLMAAVPDFKGRGRPLAIIKGSVPVLEALPPGCRFHPRCAHVFAPCAEVEPQLQSIGQRAVRCHLYPENNSLPPLARTSTTWLPHVEADQALLSVKDLKVYFKVKRRFFWQEKQWIKAVDGVSFDLHAGQTLALVGESGCGKTTVSRVLVRLMQKTSGEVFYHGQNIQDLKGNALKKYHSRVQIIFQDPYSSMNPRMTVGEIIAEGMLAQGMPAKTIEAKQLGLLDQVNLSKSSLKKYPHQFSGGQRQRIGIARALALEPEIIICDEPTSALDLSVQAQILNLLKELQQELGMAYLFITHNMAVVSYLADDLLVMRRGRIVERGKVEAVLSCPKEAYTRELLQSVLKVE